MRDTVQQPKWEELVARIATSDPAAISELYSIFQQGLRFSIRRQLGPQDLDDRVHDAFMAVVTAIQRGLIREPERLMGFARTVVRRQIAGEIEKIIISRNREKEVEEVPPLMDPLPGAEQQLLAAEEREIAISVLRALKPRERELITRFYLNGQSPAQIQTELGLTQKQFELAKSRAKLKFTDLVQRRMNRRS